MEILQNTRLYIRGLMTEITETKTSYLHKIDIKDEAYDVGIGDREIVICPQFFSPTCYVYIILLLQALLV